MLRRKCKPIMTYMDLRLSSSCFITLVLFVNLLSVCTAQFWSTYSIPRWIRSRDDSSNCPEPNGQFNHPQYCDLFLNCWNGRATVGRCGHSLVFNERIRACDYPSNVDCRGKENSNKPGVVASSQGNSRPQKPVIARPFDPNESANPPELIVSTTTTERPTTTVQSTTILTTTQRITTSQTSATTEQSTTTSEQLISTVDPGTTSESSSNTGVSETSSSVAIPILIPTSTEATTVQTRPPPPTDPRCREPNGIFVNPFNCSEFFICYGGGISVNACPDGKYFDSDYRECKDKNADSCKGDDIELSRPVPAGTPTIKPSGKNNSSNTENQPSTDSSYPPTSQSNSPQHEEMPLKPRPPLVPSTSTPASSIEDLKLPYPGLRPKPLLVPGNENSHPAQDIIPGVRPKPLLVPGRNPTDDEDNIPAVLSGIKPKPQLNPGNENFQPAQDIFSGVKPKPLLVPGGNSTDEEENIPAVQEIKPKPQLSPETESTTESDSVLPGVKPKPQLNPGDSTTDEEGNMQIVPGIKPKPQFNPELESTTESDYVLPGVKPKPQLNPGDLLPPIPESTTTESSNLVSGIKPKPQLNPGDPTTSRPEVTLPDFQPTGKPAGNFTGFRPKPPLNPSENPAQGSNEFGPSTPTTIGTLQPKPPLTPSEIDEADYDNRPPQLPAGIIDLTPPTTIEAPSSSRPPPLNPGSFKPAKPPGPGAQTTSSSIFPTSTKEPVDGIDDPNILFPFIPTYPHSFKCPIPIGLFPVLGDCESVIVCIAGQGHMLRCPEGEYFDFINGKCSTERNFICSKTNLQKSKNSDQSVIDPITGKYISVLYAYLPLSYVNSLRKLSKESDHSSSHNLSYHNLYKI